MIIHLDLSIVPIGVGVSLSGYVAACERVLRDAGLEPRLHAFGTNVEGEWDRVFAAVRRCHEVMHEMGAPRVSTTIRMGTRVDKPQTLDDKVRSVRAKLETEIMTPDQLVRAWFHDVWDIGDEAAIDRLMAPDAIVHGLAEGTIRGPGGFKPYFRAMREALGDLEVQVLRTISEGDMVVAHCHVVARHVGEALGGPATGKPVDFHGMTIARVQGGKLVEGWNCFDFLTMYQQLGWVKAPVVP